MASNRTLGVQAKGIRCGAWALSPSNIHAQILPLFSLRAGLLLLASWSSSKFASTIKFTGAIQTLSGLSSCWCLDPSYIHIPIHMHMHVHIKIHVHIHIYMHIDMDVPMHIMHVHPDLDL